VDGLAAMRPVRRGAGGTVWLRPLLGVARAELRAELRARGIDWAEDPSNAEDRFDRVRARALLARPPLPGLDADRLAATAERMAAARAVLGQAAAEAAARLAAVEHGAVRLRLPDFAALPDDTRWRILAAALCRVGGAGYRPRLAALRAAEAEALAGRRRTLHGCLLRRAAGCLWVHREPAAVAALTAPLPGVWDHRWQVEGPCEPGAWLAALAPAGLAARPGWRRTGLPRASLLTTPAVWSAHGPLAAPVLDAAMGRAAPWTAAPLWGAADIRADLAAD